MAFGGSTIEIVLLRGPALRPRRFSIERKSIELGPVSLPESQ
jgi:hypothetical protein